MRDERTPKDVCGEATKLIDRERLGKLGRTGTRQGQHNIM